jgi:predicted transcriptional regulator
MTIQEMKDFYISKALKKFNKIDEAADALGISKSTLNKYISDKKTKNKNFSYKNK